MFCKIRVIMLVFFTVLSFIGCPADEDPIVISTFPILRAADPVVLSGGNLSGIEGMPPKKLVAFSYNGQWKQVPVQVDERTVAEFYDIYNHEDSTPGIKETFYADPGTLTGPDSDPLIDANDEVVFMARDTGRKPDVFSEPPGVISGTGVEVHVFETADPLQGGYIYLFAHGGGLVSSANQHYGSYTFAPEGGKTYPDDYSFTVGPNPEDSWFKSDYYERRFRDRWLDDVMIITTPEVTNPVDILDSHDNFFGVGECGRSVWTFACGEGAFVTNKNGAVRSIRSFIGANSGPVTQRTHLLYDQREDIVTNLRVHSIPSIYDVLDYSEEALGMTYYNALNPNGVTIDGIPDTLITAEGNGEDGLLEWEMVTGPQGTLVMAHHFDTNIDITLTGYYLDLTDAIDYMCNGEDTAAYGQSGPAIISSIPSTMTLSLNHLTSYRTHYYEGPNGTVDRARHLSNMSRTPLGIAVSNWEEVQ